MFAASARCRQISTTIEGPSRSTYDEQDSQTVHAETSADHTPEEPPWELHAREMGVPAYPSGPKIRLMPVQSSSINGSQRTRSRSPKVSRAEPTDAEPRASLRANPTAIRGWKSINHLTDAMGLAGLPAPHHLEEHAAGFLRYMGPTVIINYYTTTRTALVQGKMAGTWDERLRAARTLSLHR